MYRIRFILQKILFVYSVASLACYRTLCISGYNNYHLSFFFFKKWELEWILIVKNKCNMCILACKCTYCTRLGFLVSYAFRFLIRKVQKFKQNLGYHYEEVFLHRENCSFSSWKCFSDGHWTTSILENKIESHF